MTRSLFVSPVIIFFSISIQCQGWLSGRSERLGGTLFGSADQPEHWAWTDRRWLLDSDALSLKSRCWAGIRNTGLTGISCKAMGSEMRSRLGSKTLGSEALVGEALAKALARRPLVRKVMATVRGACQRNTG